MTELSALSPPATGHALYRHFDADGQLLYAGITHDPGKRWKQHRNKPWWHHVANTTVERFPSRAAVLAAEQEAIKAERPWCNIDGNDTIVEHRKNIRLVIGEFIAHWDASRASTSYHSGWSTLAKDAYELGFIHALRRECITDRTHSRKALTPGDDLYVWFKAGDVDAGRLIQLCEEREKDFYIRYDIELELRLPDQPRSPDESWLHRLLDVTFRETNSTLEFEQSQTEMSETAEPAYLDLPATDATHDRMELTSWFNMVWCATVNQSGEPYHVEPDWIDSVARFLRAGLSRDEIRGVVQAVMRSMSIHEKWAAFCSGCEQLLRYRPVS